jgi:hypothetical protein
MSRQPALLEQHEDHLPRPPAVLVPLDHRQHALTVVLVDAHHDQRGFPIDGRATHKEVGTVDVEVLEAAPRQGPIQEGLGRREDGLERVGDLLGRHIHAQDAPADLGQRACRQAGQVQ